MIAAAIGIWLVTPNQKQEPNTIIVGISADNPPYSFMKDNQFEGFELDLIKEIARKMDKKITLKEMEFHSLIASLNNKTIDMAIASISITEERAARVEFSTPYSDNKMSLLTTQDSNIHSLSHLQGKAIGVQLGTNCAIAANDIAKNMNSTVTILSNNLLLLKELNAKRVDALILDETLAYEFAQQDNKLVITKLDNYSHEFAIAFPKNSQYKNAVDIIIQDLKNTGFISDLQAKWKIGQ